ncbi:hypothetical protein [Vibrio coralliilyticus]|uniref:Uncharacterized protein n=1 Tax=Vibrio coralliilyticus TaxID=190893 RepID=A0AAP6ZVC1_9VIBR|nr:hypothetical protein [Vibrio coralliilyticus]NOI32278.1 hypothetical protein [Vibrio coralliilyticus]NOJ25323.1 hypothetical protein [Vibrio coralliilyticus]
MNSQELKDTKADERKARRKLWSDFYEQEKAFFEWLNEKAVILKDIGTSTPMFSITGEPAKFGYEHYTLNSGQTATRPPRFIRKIICLRDNSDLNACKSKYEVVKEAFVNAASYMTEKEVRYPQRFPMFLEQVEQINYSTDDAYSSRLVPPTGKFTLYSGSLDKELRSLIVSEFKASGFKSLTVETDNFGLTMLVSIDIDELRSFFGCSESTIIRSRRHTGTQYTCRVSFLDANQKSIRCKFGLLILDSNTNEIYRSTPRKKRNDTLEEKATEVFLPVDLGMKFFLSDKM